MSLTRAIRRAAFRKQGREWTGKTVPHRVDDYGYVALHPTRGWRSVSAKRLYAQRAMAEMLDHVLPAFVRRSKPFDPALNRHTGKPHQHAREIARNQRSA